MNTTRHAIERSIELINHNDYLSAARLLLAAGYDPDVHNLLGVCLMRLGEFEQAVQVYRQLVLMPGSVLERPDINEVYKRNFATALLLKGFPSGALEVLAAMQDSYSLRAVQIRAAIVKWEKSLSLLRWLDWKINAIEPPCCKVAIDFEPGEIELDTAQLRPDGSARPDVGLAA